MMSVRSLLQSSLLLAIFAGTSACAHETTNPGSNAQIPVDNPIVLQRADPQLVRHDNGCYTFIGTSPKFDEIALRQACRLNDLKLAEEKVIWRKRESGPMSANIWAPELHEVDGDWYIYFAAGEKETPFSIRMYALKNTHEDPMKGDWETVGRMETHLDTFSLDATTFTHNDKRYLVWAQQNAERSYNSALWIAEMDSPVTVKAPIVKISEPTLDWEVQGYKVNEGASVVKHGDKLFMTYSASATDHRYAMGLLWAEADADLLDPASWHKEQEPVFTTAPELGRFGPGHNSFVKAKDGETDLMIYHSRDYKELQGSPLSDPNRHARARVLTWNEKGFPEFKNAIRD